MISAAYNCTYIVHTAAPNIFKSPYWEDHMIKPAVNGTIIMCKAALKHKIKRLVLTSSVTANMYGH